jgi:hypothetical protein
LTKQQKAQKNKGRRKSLVITFNLTQIKKLPKNHVSYFLTFLFREATTPAHAVKNFKVHTGAFLPRLFPGLAALGSLVGGAAAVKKTVLVENNN